MRTVRNLKAQAIRRPWLFVYLWLSRRSSSQHQLLLPLGGRDKAPCGVMRMEVGTCQATVDLTARVLYENGAMVGDPRPTGANDGTIITVSPGPTAVLTAGDRLVLQHASTQASFPFQLRRVRSDLGRRDQVCYPQPSRRVDLQEGEPLDMIQLTCSMDQRRPTSPQMQARHRKPTLAI